MNAKFSIIIPIYKVEAFIRKSIESVLNQTYKDFELILVDDGSPDNCPMICDEYAEKDNRIKVIHKTNGGLVSARNAGLKEACGDYICYLDGDDWLDVTLLHKINEKAISTYGAEIVIFNMVKQFNNHQEKIPFFVDEGFFDKQKLQDEIYPYMMWDRRKRFYNGLVFPSSGGKIIKREILLEHYCKDERIRMGEDNAFIFECIYAADSIYFLPEDLYIYNQLNENSFHHSYDKDRLKNNRFLVDYIKNNMGQKEKVIDEQLNAFKAYWLIMAIFHEVKCKRSIFSSRKHLKNDIKTYHTLSDIDLEILPSKVKLYLLLVKYRFYICALIGAWVINSLRKQ